MGRKPADFTEVTIRHLRLLAGDCCSRCKTCTGERIGSRSKPTGDAAHILAAATDGPRYIENMTDVQRCHPDNAIWLCKRCHTIVDSDVTTYTEVFLKSMRQSHEVWISKNRPDPDRAKLVSVLLDCVGKEIFVQRESYRRNQRDLQPSLHSVVDLDEHSVVLTTGNHHNYTWPLRQVHLESYVHPQTNQKWAMLVWDDR